MKRKLAVKTKEGSWRKEGQRNWKISGVVDFGDKQ